jgi:hypothetical protein
MMSWGKARVNDGVRLVLVLGGWMPPKIPQSAGFDAF